MTLYASGLNGSVSINGTETFKISGWSLTASAEALPITKLDDNAPVYRYGRQSYSGRLTSYYYVNTPFASGGSLEAAQIAQAIIRTSTIPTSVTTQLKLNTTQDKSFTCNVLITNIEIGVQAGGITTMDAGFQVTGNLVEASGAT